MATLDQLVIERPGRETWPIYDDMLFTDCPESDSSTYVERGIVTAAAGLKR